MDDEQKKLYNEWRTIEEDLRKTIIQYSDIEKAKQIRPCVWDKLKNHLSIAEKFELGASLEKPLKEVFDKKYPPDSWPLAKQWATKAIHRASGGFNFLLECLEHIHRGSTDPAYSRSAYILLSINCELLFEAYLLLLLKDDHARKTEEELMELLKGKRNHDLKELAEKIGEDDLIKLGIKSVNVETKNDLKRYIIVLANDEKIIVEDLVTVRYDFKYDRRRDIDPDESNRMKKELDHLFKTTKIVMEMVPK